MRRQTDAKIGSIIKMALGFCGALILLLLVFGPMLLFSSLNPTFEPNPISKANATLDLIYNNTNYYNIY